MQAGLLLPKKERKAAVFCFERKFLQLFSQHKTKTGPFRATDGRKVCLVVTNDPIAQCKFFRTVHFWEMEWIKMVIVQLLTPFCPLHSLGHSVGKKIENIQKKLKVRLFKGSFFLIGFLVSNRA